MLGSVVAFVLSWDSGIGGNTAREWQRALVGWKVEATVPVVPAIRVCQAALVGGLEASTKVAGLPTRLNSYGQS